VRRLSKPEGVLDYVENILHFAPHAGLSALDERKPECARTFFTLVLSARLSDRLKNKKFKKKEYFFKKKPLWKQ